ncbi:hypothetical protein [Photorhabdus heterorhabditis]|uniref:XRE family transcriptional regulator n=1 Tax=Photorhabdus heterorhabditis TaxID=880156 RepID=A0A5B0WHT4_9GAMM|nr:hypothetical protein [Photorhabdus heterorhabditis]KAA1186376.1 hypothetical protein F0L16_14230 [Photorhabdus heterorhabditis]
MTVNIDTKIRHVTPIGKNIFSELGFDAQEAQQLNTNSLYEIANTLAIKEKLIGEITLDRKQKTEQLL